MLYATSVFGNISMGLKKISTICRYAVLTCPCLPVPNLRAQIAEASLMRVCEAQVSAKFREWRFAPVSPDVERFAKSRNVSPTKVFGDFDGDGRRDVALLFLDGPDPNPQYPGRLD